MTITEEDLQLLKSISHTLTPELIINVNNFSSSTSNDELNPILQEVYEHQSSNIHTLYQEKEILNENKKKLDNLF